MSLRCREIEVRYSRNRRKLPEHVAAAWVDKATGKQPIPGDLFYAPWYAEEEWHRESLTAAYWALPEPRRAPIVVVLPTGSWHCVDSMYYNQQQGWHGGWSVAGTIPNLSVTPSIHIVGHWHGNLTNGELITV